MPSVPPWFLGQTPHISANKRKAFVGKSLQIATGLRLPGSELLDTADTSHSAFGLKKLAVCTTDVGKIYALDMADGSVAW